MGSSISRTFARWCAMPAIRASPKSRFSQPRIGGSGQATRCCASASSASTRFRRPEIYFLISQRAVGIGLCALFDLLLRLEELLDFAQCIVSAQGFAFGHRTLVFLAFFSLKFSLRSSSSFAVEKSFLCIHRSPFFGALIFPISQEYTLPHKVYVGLFWLAAVVPQVRHAVSCHEAANGQRCDCYLVQPDLHTLMTYQPRADNRPRER